MNENYQIITVYEISGNPEAMDSRDVYRVLARAGDENVAKEILKEDLNGRGKITPRPGILLPDGACYLLYATAPVEIERNKEDLIRKIALSKLSAQEKKSLGVSSEKEE